jgi:hypothetical protein
MGAAARISQLARTYPGISPGLAYSLASSGYGVSDTAEKLWQQDLRSRQGRMPGQRKRGRHDRLTEDVEKLSTEQRLNRIVRKVKSGDISEETGRKRAERIFSEELSGGGFGDVMGGISDFLRPGTEAIFGRGDDPILSKAPVVGKAVSGTHTGIKGGIRALGTVGLASGEATAGIARQFGDVLEDPTSIAEPRPLAAEEVVRQTSLYQATRQGGPLGAATQTGEGFIPDPRSRAVRAAAEAARLYSPYTIGGSAWTPGRAFANVFFEPDDDYYKMLSGTIDLGVALKTDPASAFLSTTALARASRKVVVADELYEHSLVVGKRNGFLPEAASQHFQRSKVRDALEEIRAEKNPWEIAHRTGVPIVTQTGEKMAENLALSDDIDEIMSIYERNLPEVTGGVKWNKPVKHFERWRTDLPSIGKPIKWGADADLNDFAAQMDRHLVNMGASYEVRKAIGTRAATVGNDAMKQEELVGIFADTYAETLRLAGASDDIIAKGRSAFANRITAEQGYVREGIDDLTLFNPQDVQVATTAGRLGDAVLEEQLFHNVAYLPDARTIRAEVAQYNKLASHPAYQNTQEVLDMGMDFWKRITLARPATGLRITGEEQLRLAAYGLASLAHHPLTALTFIIGNPDNRWIDRAYRIAGDNPALLPWAMGAEKLKAKIGVTPSKLYQPGGTLRNPLADALYQRFEAVMGHQKVMLGGFTKIDTMDTQNPLAAHAGAALGDMVMRFREDDLVMSIVHNGADATKDAFKNGHLRNFREYYATIPQKHAIGYDDVAADAFVDDVSRALNDMTGNNQDILEAIRVGQIKGRRIYDGRGNVRPSAQREFDHILNRGRNVRMLQADRDAAFVRGENLADLTTLERQEIEAFSAFPREISIPRERTLTPASRSRALKRLDNGLNYFLDAFLTRPSNYFSRNLMSQQVFLESMERSFPYVDAAGRRKILSLMDEANLPKKVRRDFEYMNRRIGEVNATRGGQQLFPDRVPTPGDIRAVSLRGGPTGRVEKVDVELPAIPEGHVRFYKLGDERLGEYRRNPTKMEGQKLHWVDVPADHPRVVAGGDLRISRSHALAGRVQGGESVRNYKVIPRQTQKTMLTYEEVGKVAAHQAVNSTKDILYDLSKRGQTMDMLRLLFPFGEAFKEVVSRWMKLTWANKAVLRRLEQGIFAARQEDSNAIYSAAGIPDVPVDVTDPTQGMQGLWQKDQFGQEVFMYPGSNLLTNALFDVPIPLKGSVSGLNLIGNGLPGVGPMVQFPAAWLMGNKPSTDTVRQMIFPVGQPSPGDLFPGWIQKGWKAIFGNPNSDRIFGSTVGDVAKYLVSTGDYDLEGPNATEEMSRLMDDAVKGARGTYIIRSLGQFTLPSSPSPNWVAYDKKGNLTMLWAMLDWYHKKAEDPNIGYEEAFNMFLDRFGTKNFFAPQPKSAAIVPGAPITADEYKWARENPQFKDRYPKTYGLFAPPDPEGEMDSEAYEANFEQGERIPLTPERMIRLANARLANKVYEEAKLTFGKTITESEETALRELRTELQREFPGYKDDPINFTRKEVLIAELENAVDDPDLKSNEATKALKEYLEIRQITLARLERQGLASFKAKAASSNSRMLWFYGEDLVDKYPAFQRMWDSVFKGELQEMDLTLGSVTNP